MSMSGSEVAVGIAWSLEEMFARILPALPQRAAVATVRGLLLFCEKGGREPLATIAKATRATLTREAAKHRGRL